MKKILTIMLTALTLTACNEKVSNKTLIVYYSQTGATKSVATEIQNQIGGDIEQLEVENPYDGDFMATIARCQEEMAKGELPVLKPIVADIAQYDTIYLGYPVWFGTFAPPVQTFLKEQSLEGKVVIPFCTFGSGGLIETVDRLKEMLPNSTIFDGYGVRNARIASAPTELNRYLIERGYKAGEVEALPGFLETQPVTDEQIAIFDAACGNYQFPLGTPVEVAVRECSTSTDYMYIVNSNNPDGSVANSTIYVTVAKSEGAQPEFTLVVRK